MRPFTLLAIGAMALIVRAAIAIGYPQARLTIKVLDDKSNPVEAADVGIGFQVMSKKYFGNEEIDIRGLTNAKGEFGGTAQGDSNLGFTVRKAGYYETTGKYDFKEAVGDKWQPWNPTVEIVLKKVENPIAMYAKNVDLVIPAFDNAVGFDLMAGDWVTPHGKGKTSDFIFRAHLQQRSKNDYDYELVVTFVNPQDGLQPFDAPRFYGSKMKSPRLAPESGYLAEWKQLRKRRPGQPEVSNVSDSRNYLFRVRTVVDESGNIVSALYGKIYGDFLRFSYYVNPSANDRNMEFDPKRNLFTNLKDLERPTAP